MAQEDEQRNTYAKRVTDLLSGRQTTAEERVPTQINKPSRWVWNTKTNEPVPTGYEKQNISVPIDRPLSPDEQAYMDNEYRMKLEALGATVPREMRVDTSNIFPVTRPNQLSFEQQMALRQAQPPSQAALDIEKKKQAQMSANINFQKLVANYMKDQTPENQIALKEGGTNLGYELNFSPKPILWKRWFGDNPPAIIARKGGKTIYFDNSGNEISPVKEKKKDLGSKYGY